LKALNCLDLNNDGTIDFSEFMALFELDDEELESKGH
jgi:Ca2+-binding EF-hand superfamily protein